MNIDESKNQVFTSTESDKASPSINFHRPSMFELAQPGLFDGCEESPTVSRVPMRPEESVGSRPSGMPMFSFKTTRVGFLDTSAIVFSEQSSDA